MFAASFLAGRSWQGLEPKLGETPVVKAVQGRRGIAIAYEEEGTDSKDYSTWPQKRKKKKEIRKTSLQHVASYLL